MAAPKCGSCKHYSKKYGCDLELNSYDIYRNCILDQNDLYESAGDACDEEPELHLPSLTEIMERNRQKRIK